MTADNLSNHTLFITGSDFQSGNIVQFKWGVGPNAGAWNTGQGNPPSITNSSQMSISMNPGPSTDVIYVRVCRSGTQTTTADCSSGTQFVTVTAPATVAPAVSSISPTTMTADGLSHALSISGSGFQNGNIVQFKWGVGSGAGVWTTGNGNPPSIANSGQMSISMNPGPVTDVINVRVCRSASQTTTADCSSGTEAVVVTAK